MAFVGNLVLAVVLGFALVAGLQVYGALFNHEASLRRAWATDFSIPDSWPVFMSKFGFMMGSRKVSKLRINSAAA